MELFKRGQQKEVFTEMDSKEEEGGGSLPSALIVEIYARWFSEVKIVWKFIYLIDSRDELCQPLLH